MESASSSPRESPTGSKVIHPGFEPVCFYSSQINGKEFPDYDRARPPEWLGNKGSRFILPRAGPAPQATLWGLQCRLARSGKRRARGVRTVGLARHPHGGRQQRRRAINGLLPPPVAQGNEHLLQKTSTPDSYLAQPGHRTTAPETTGTGLGCLVGQQDVRPELCGIHICLCVGPRHRGRSKYLLRIPSYFPRFP